MTFCQRGTIETTESLEKVQFWEISVESEHERIPDKFSSSQSTKDPHLHPKTRRLLTKSLLKVCLVLRISHYYIKSNILCLSDRKVLTEMRRETTISDIKSSLVILQLL